MTSFDIEFLAILAFQFILVPSVLWVATKLHEKKESKKT